MPKPDHLWNEHEAARYLGVSHYAIRKWAKAGKIGKIKLGTSVRYDPAEMRAFAEASREHPVCEKCHLPISQQPALLPNEVDPQASLYAAG